MGWGGGWGEFERGCEMSCLLRVTREGEGIPT